MKQFLHIAALLVALIFASSCIPDRPSGEKTPKPPRTQLIQMTTGDIVPVAFPAIPKCCGAYTRSLAMARIQFEGHDYILLGATTGYHNNLEWQVTNFIHDPDCGLCARRQ